MLNKLESFREATWPVIQRRFGREKFAEHFQSASLVGFMNWTMLPHMSEIWEALLVEVCPSLTGPRHKMFFDLADPGKRTREDLKRALDLILRFEKHFDVILGLNEKEAEQVGEILAVELDDARPTEALCNLAAAIRDKLRVNTVVVHPVTCAASVGAKGVSLVEGPRLARLRISTGGGDHFNAGFCLGKLLELDDELCLLLGVATSGHYVSTANSPTVQDLIGMLENWPEEKG